MSSASGDGIAQAVTPGTTMRYMTRFCIFWLATLIQWSSPRYIGQRVFSSFHRSFLIACLVVISSVTVFSSPSDDESAIPAQSSVSANLPDSPYDFPLPEELRAHVEFWKNIFSRYAGHQAVIYDEWYPQIIYDVIDTRTTSLDSIIKKYRQILLNLDRQERRQRSVICSSSEELRIYQLFANISEQSKFHKAATQRMRTQFGQAEQFTEAVRRSLAYQKTFEQIFREHRLPVELTRIPFVESYFKTTAYSRTGAAGIWQFMPATARLYGLRVTRRDDERYEPFKSAASAAKLLQAHYDIFQSWPLAISAYHQGSARLLQATKSTGTNDLGKIVTRFSHPQFGFYSRNYYAQFLAVVHIMRDYDAYFGVMNPHAMFE